MLNELRHPLVQSWLGELRDVQTPSARFRELLRSLSVALFLEATRDLPTTPCTRRTPLAEIEGEVAAAPVLVPVLRAGLGMVDGILPLVPEASVHHLGVYRCHETLRPISYYSPAVPAAGRWIYLLDPMLATGGSATAAIETVREWSGSQIRLLCVLAAPEGVAQVHAAHPDVTIYTCALDSHLNDRGYIVPGLGDAGDRQFGT